MRAKPYLAEVRLKREEIDSYQETEHYRVTRDFLMNPERMLEVLLEPDPQRVD